MALLLPLALEEVEVADEAIDEPRRVLLVVAEGAQQDEDAHAPLAGDARAGGDVLAGLVLDVELHPLAAVRVDRALDELVLAQVAEAVPLAGFEDDAGAAHELRDDDALGAVDDERALLGHHREVAHEDRLLLDLTRVPVHEPGTDEDRSGVGHVLLLALLHRELRRRAQVLVVRVELELELQRLAEVLDRRDVAERLRQPLVQEPLEAVLLDRDQVGELERLLKVGERIPLAGHGTSGHSFTPQIRSGTGRAAVRPTNGRWRETRSTATDECTENGRRTSTVAGARRTGRSGAKPYAQERPEVKDLRPGGGRREAPTGCTKLRRAGGGDPCSAL